MSERRRLRAALAGGQPTPTQEGVPDWMQRFERARWSPYVQPDADPAGRTTWSRAKARREWECDIVLWCAEHDINPAPYLVTGWHRERIASLDAEPERWRQWRAEHAAGARSRGPAPALSAAGGLIRSTAKETP